MPCRGFSSDSVREGLGIIKEFLLLGNGPECKKEGRMQGRGEHMREGRRTAVVLAAGTGSRMHSNVAKQFLQLGKYPLIYYSLKAMEDSAVIDDVILVTGEGDMPRMQAEIVAKYGFRKVRTILAGGSERCFSVANAMRFLEATENPETMGYVFIHDGARPFLTEDILLRTYEEVKLSGACVAAVPSKDTVKLADEEGYADCTPERGKVWIVQTPQVFERKLIISAYRMFEQSVRDGAGQAAEHSGGHNAGQAVEHSGGRNAGQAAECNAGHNAGQAADCSTGRISKQGDGSQKAPVTDDASVVELFTDRKVKLVEGAYSNIKVTTPEDLAIANALLEGRAERP